MGIASTSGLQDTAKMRALYEGGASLREIGDRYDMTPEGVRQRLKKAGLSGLRDRRKSLFADRRAERAWDRLQRRCEEVVARDLRCTVCGGWVIRTKTGPVNPEHSHRTCSPICARAWRTPLRYVLCGECRRKHIETCYQTPSMQAGPNGAWLARRSGSYPLSIQRGKTAHRLLQELRPDLLKQIPFMDEIDRPQWNGGTKALQKSGVS